MKLATFTPENTVSTRNGAPCFHLNGKTGLININRIAVEKLGLKKGAHLVFHQDEEHKGDWYIEIVSKGGFEFREVEGGNVMMNNTALVRKIFDSIEFSGNSGRVLLAGQPTKEGGKTLYGLLVTTLKNK